MPCTNIGPGYARLSFPVAIVENVGHESRIISVLCDLFLKKRGTILCVVTDWPSSNYKDI